jgi:hypothetical protein
MQFIQNKISVGKNKSFEDICQEYVDKKNATVKTASTEEVVKVAEADEAEGSGQLDVEPLHQEGESTDQGSVGGGKSDDGGCGPKKAADEEGESSGQPEAEGKEELNNDPYDDPKIKADADTEVKVAEHKCETCDCDPCSCKEATATEEEEKDAETKEAGVKGNCADCGKPNFICKCKGDSDSDDSDSDEKEDKEASADATVKIAFKEIANLTSEEKTRLGKYWKNIYPDAFVDALLADK